MRSVNTFALFFSCLSSWLISSVPADASPSADPADSSTTCKNDTIMSSDYDYDYHDYTDKILNDFDGPWWKNENMKNVHMWALLDCGEVIKVQRPIHNESIWALIRGAYIGVVGPDKSYLTLEDGAEEGTIPMNILGNGFKSGSIEVKQIEGKGRAVYATSQFKKGEVVWYTDFTACFNEGMLYRKYLASIPADLACDVMVWAYSGSYGVCVDLDEGSLINHAASKEANREAWEFGDEKPNIIIDKDLHIASVDINPGDELLIDYLSFDDDESYDLLGLGTW